MGTQNSYLEEKNSPKGYKSCLQTSERLSCEGEAYPFCMSQEEGINPIHRNSKRGLVGPQATELAF